MAIKSKIVEKLIESVQMTWPSPPSVKAKKYVGKFTHPQRIGQKIEAKVNGNYGIYTVSIQLEGENLSSACSCYIGDGGFCHHCEALAFTFQQEFTSFKIVKNKKKSDVQDIKDLRKYLKSVTLDTLIGSVSFLVFCRGLGYEYDF